jgi:hypothetical protein
MESIPPACVAWRAGYGNPIPTWFPAHIDCLKIPVLVSTSRNSVLQVQEEYPGGAGCLHAGADLRGQDPVQALLRPRPPLLHPLTGNFSPYTLPRKSHLFVPRKGIARGLRSNFNILVSVADPRCLSRIPLFSIPDSGSELSPSRIPDPHQRI